MIAKTSLNVRYSETNKMGIVHHSNYPIWFEAGRNDYLKKIGISNARIEALGFFLPLSEIRFEIKSPAKYEDEITVITNIVHMTCARVKFEYKVLNKLTGKLLATGRTVHAWTNSKIQPLNIQKAAPEIYRLLKQSFESFQARIK